MSLLTVQVVGMINMFTVSTDAQTCARKALGGNMCTFWKAESSAGS